jgi:hypothetical protein
MGQASAPTSQRNRPAMGKLRFISHARQWIAFLGRRSELFDQEHIDGIEPESDDHFGGREGLRQCSAIGRRDPGCVRKPRAGHRHNQVLDWGAAPVQEDDGRPELGFKRERLD